MFAADRFGFRSTAERGAESPVKSADASRPPVDGQVRADSQKRSQSASDADSFRLDSSTPEELVDAEFDRAVKLAGEVARFRADDLPLTDRQKRAQADYAKSFVAPLSGFPNFDLLRLDYANSLRLEGLR